MIKLKLKDTFFDTFIEEYKSNIVSISEDKILLRCILPGHSDRNRSAVLYKSGVYSCPSCGSFKMDGECEVVPISSSKPPTLEVLYFPIEHYPLHFFEGENVILAANVIDNKVVGITKRINNKNRKRWYETKGEPGFRLFAPVITESLTDAICLLKLGINAGSICSVANYRKVPNTALFVPQADKAGLDLLGKLKHTQIWKWFWYVKGYKDINDLPKETLKLLIKELPNQLWLETK